MSGRRRLEKLAAFLIFKKTSDVVEDEFKLIELELSELKEPIKESDYQNKPKE